MEDKKTFIFDKKATDTVFQEVEEWLARRMAEHFASGIEEIFEKEDKEDANS